MKSHLVKKVKSGEKTQTIRVWKRTPPKIGTVCSINFKAPRIVIMDCYQKSIGELNSDELKRDGFASMEEFKKVWAECYPENPFDPLLKVWIIRFQLAPDTPMMSSSAEKKLF